MHKEGPCGSTGAQHYLDGGFTFLATPNLQFDVRGGVGVSRAADDHFFGAGVVIRR